VIKMTHEVFMCVLMLLIGGKGDPGPTGSTQLTSQGMKGEKGNDGLPGPMGLKGEQGDALMFSFITLYVYTRTNWISW